MPMMKPVSHSALATFSAALPLLVMLQSTVAFALSPTQEIKSTVDQVIKIVTNPRLQDRTKRAQRLKLLRDAIFVRFDFREMAKRSLGLYWHRRSPDQQNEFVRLFTDLLAQAYVVDIESYNNNDKFIYTAERLDGSYAEVDSKVRRPSGEEVTLNYHLHLTNNDWKVYDVVIDDLSLVNNYRSQFNHVIYSGSYDELVRRLKDKLSSNNDVG